MRAPTRWPFTTTAQQFLIRWHRPERRTVGHTLWNIRTPYPTAITCPCGRVLYRFGDELRHRDGTVCAGKRAA